MKELWFIITKKDCPFCERAKQLLATKTFLDTRESLVEDLDQAKRVAAGLELEIPEGYNKVPMIWNSNGQFIEGFTGLLSYEWPKDQTNKKTVFNQYATGHITGQYPLFLGESGGFADTINNPYPQLEKFFQKQQSFHWNEFEVDLTQDRQDMLSAPPGKVALMVKTILWQSLVDSVAARSISGVLMDYVSNPTLEGLYNIIAYFESIHSRTYLHIIKQTFVDPNESLKEGYADQDIMGRSEVLRRAFDDLLNTPYDAPEAVKRKGLYKALVAMYMLERLNFMASFAITFGIAETGVFQGISQNVALICRDEMLHAKVGEFILKTEMQEHPEVFKELQPEIEAIFYEILQREKDWTDKLFSEGRYCENLTAERVKNYVMYEGGFVAETLNITDFAAPNTNPLPYMEDYINSDNVQVAPQELQISNYLVNSVKAISNRPKLKEALLYYAQQ